MITDRTAQRIASEWHGGQSSALYALASSGAIIQPELNNELDETYFHAAMSLGLAETPNQSYVTKSELDLLYELTEYARQTDERGPVDGRHALTIAKG